MNPNRPNPVRALLLALCLSLLATASLGHLAHDHDAPDAGPETCTLCHFGVGAAPLAATGTRTTPQPQSTARLPVARLAAAPARPAPHEVPPARAPPTRC